MKKNFLFLFTALSILIIGVPRVHAQTASDLVVTPAVIDEKGKPRDILKESITVKNMSSHALDLYPSVYNINIEEGKQSFSVARNSDDLAASLANWIELSRGVVELGPGEQRTIPFIIHLNLNAIPGTYHAQITLTEGLTRVEAEALPPLGTIMVNMEVQADVKELLQLSAFSTGNIFLSGDDVLFNYKLQNIGNQDLQPKGQVRIYDRRGQEVATVPVNKDGKIISPDQDSQLASVWSAVGGFGRYKAMLDVSYGANQLASVQDTVFFWIIPWKQMLIMFTVSLITVIVLALYFHRWLERRHLYKFAHAGLLNDDTLQKINTEDMGAVPLPSSAPHRMHIKETPRPEHKSLREVLHKEETPTHHGSSIDLKQLRAHAQAAKAHAHQVPQTQQTTKAEVHGHVISLKKHTS